MADDIEAYLKPPPTAPLARSDKSLEEDFYSRAVKLHTSARNILNGMIVLLCLGALVFFIAPFITYFDFSILKPENFRSEVLQNKAEQDFLLEEISKNTKTYSKTIKGFRKKLVDYFTAEDKNKGAVRTESRPPITLPYFSEKEPEAALNRGIDGWDDLNDRSIPICSSLQFDGMDGVPYTAGACISLDKWREISKNVGMVDMQAAQQLRDVSEKISKLSDARTLAVAVGQNLFSKEVNAITGESTKRQQAAGKSIDSVIQTSITRFGFLAVVTFLVAILSPLYRYNKRLAAFYMARGDALRFKREGFYEADFRQMSSALTPSYDFGKSPKMPLEQLVELLKASKGG